MLRLLKRNALYYLLPVCTFVSGLSPLTRGRTGYFSAMALFVPAWLSASVLWSESEDAPAFLRVLPVTDREIVLSKFSLALMATAVYSLVLCFLAVHIEEGYFGLANDSLAANFTVLCLCCVFGLLLACGWNVAIWRFGLPAMTPIMVTYIVLNVLGSILITIDFRSRNWGGPHVLPLIFWLVCLPLYLIFALVFAAILAFYGVLELAVRTREKCSF